MQATLSSRWFLSLDFPNYYLTNFLVDFLEVGKQLGVKDTNFTVKVLELAVSDDGVTVLLNLVNELREKRDAVFLCFRQLINRGRLLLPNRGSSDLGRLL